MPTNTNVLKILRNQTLFATRELALTNIQAKVSGGVVHDGELWLATYGTSSQNAKSIIAVYHQGNVTTFDLDSISGDIDTQIQQALATLAPIATSGLASDATTTPITASSTTVAVSGTNAADQIASLGQTMKTIESNSNKYKMLQLTAAEITALSDANVKEAYKVVSYQGEDVPGTTTYTQVGDVVKIYKDSALQEVYLGANTDTINATTGVITKNTVTDPQSMNFAYQLADGTYSLTKIDVSKFLTDSEFGDGLQVSGAGVVSVKADTTSSDAESFITVGANGVKISGVQDAIDTSIAALDATVGSTTVASGNHIAVQIVEADGVLTGVTVTEDDIASQDYVEEIERVISNSLNDLETRKADKTDLDTLSGAALEQVVAGNGVNVSAKSNNSQTVSVKLDTTNDSTPGSANALTLSSDGLYLSETIDCGTY